MFAINDKLNSTNKSTGINNTKQISEGILKGDNNMTKRIRESTGKIILIGEHAVTFGQPAIAIPFNSGKIKVLIESLEKEIIQRLKVMFMMDYCMMHQSI